MARKDKDVVPGDMERAVDVDDAEAPRAGEADEESLEGAAREAPRSGTPVQNPGGDDREDPRLSAGEVAEGEVEQSKTQGNIQSGYEAREE